VPDVTIKRVSDFVRDVDDGTLMLKPAFQRRLVWTNVVKDHFLETVNLKLPFPEVFIATGGIDTKSMKRKNLLVDGQQRITTLRDYVKGSPDLDLSLVKPYAQLTEKEKEDFLDYKVAVRDLGMVTEDQLKDIFSRINSTDYSLNAIERLNAMFSGAYKNFCDDLSRHPFFNRHNVFSMLDSRRMRDLDFGVILTTTVLSTYYQRDSLNREYLKRYNDKFAKRDKLWQHFEAIFQFIEDCGFDKKCRVWKKTDLFTLIVELYAALITGKKPLKPSKVKPALEEFYGQVASMFSAGIPDEEPDTEASNRDVFKYLKAATKATNDKYARLDRASVISGLLDSTLQTTKKRASSAPKKTLKKKAKATTATRKKS